MIQASNVYIFVKNQRDVVIMFHTKIMRTIFNPRAEDGGAGGHKENYIHKFFWKCAPTAPTPLKKGELEPNFTDKKEKSQLIKGSGGLRTPVAPCTLCDPALYPSPSHVRRFASSTFRLRQPPLPQFLTLIPNINTVFLTHSNHSHFSILD